MNLTLNVPIVKIKQILTVADIFVKITLLITLIVKILGFLTVDFAIKVDYIKSFFIIAYSNQNGAIYFYSTNFIAFVSESKYIIKVSEL